MTNHEEFPVPVYDTLEPIYGEGSQLEEARIRFENLKSKFLAIFGQPPQVFARSPGRVNLIGEHIDYEGYSVLPMAIRQDTIVAIRKNEDERIIRVANVNDEKYTTCTYPADSDQELDLRNHKWGHYFICGLWAIKLFGICLFLFDCYYDCIWCKLSKETNCASFM